MSLMPMACAGFAPAIGDAGYLRLTGRLKEIINRGGEKISPLEMDDILLDHPSVAQVVTFAVVHAKPGEDVAAAVVLTETPTPTLDVVLALVQFRARTAGLYP
jgi:acyl-coenzyme A synthetase/AMP-(fatty) acid ligase